MLNVENGKCSMPKMPKMPHPNAMPEWRFAFATQTLAIFGIRHPASSLVTSSQQSDLLCGGLRSTVPRLVQIGNRRARGQRLARRRNQTGSLVRDRPDAREHVLAWRVQAGADEPLDRLLQRVDARVGVAPDVRQRRRVEARDPPAHLFELEHQRAV